MSFIESIDRTSHLGAVQVSTPSKLPASSRRSIPAPITGRLAAGLEAGLLVALLSALSLMFCDIAAGSILS